MKNGLAIWHYPHRTVEENVYFFKEMGFEINDLNSLVKADVYKYIRDDDKIHLTDEGIDLCANQVVKVIKGELVSC